MLCNIIRMNEKRKCVRWVRTRAVSTGHMSRRYVWVLLLCIAQNAIANFRRLLCSNDLNEILSEHLAVNKSELGIDEGYVRNTKNSQIIL